MLKTFPFLEHYPYLVAAAIVSGAVAVSFSYFLGLMPDKSKAHLSLWLQGDYDATWSQTWGEVFDNIFGKKHFSLRCFCYSALFSILTVLFLWLLLGPLLGLISHRSGSELTLVQALLFGAALNVIPDYFSLWETRWLLRSFEKVRTVTGQLLVLLADLLFTGFIIWGSMTLFFWATNREMLSIVEMVGFYSIFAVFFYSTFATSAWAWVHCIAAWFTKITSNLGWLFDVKKKPVAAFTRVASITAFVGTASLTPILIVNKDTGRTLLDDTLCSLFPGNACEHLVRFTSSESEQLALLDKACMGGSIDNCSFTALQFMKREPEVAMRLMSKACKSGEAHTCSIVGHWYLSGLGGEQSLQKGVSSYKRSCLLGDYSGCVIVGLMYEVGEGLDRDFKKAKTLYQYACDNRYPTGCSYLGQLYEKGRGVEISYLKAAKLYQSGCDGDDGPGCTNLGRLYEVGKGVDQSNLKAIKFYQLGCEAYDNKGCARAAEVEARLNKSQ